MVSNPVPLKPPPCLQANVTDAETEVDKVSNPTSAVILVARAIATSRDREAYEYTCWTLVNSTIAYSTRFHDRAALSAFVTRMQAFLAGKIGAQRVVVADASTGTSALPCPPPEDLTTVRSLIDQTRAAAIAR